MQRDTLSCFEELCSTMDKDLSGDVSVEEVIAELQVNSELQTMLGVLGIKERDVKSLIEIIDSNENGVLDYEEFINEFSDMKTHVFQTTIFFVFKYVQSLHRQSKQEMEILRHIQRHLDPAPGESILPANADEVVTPGSQSLYTAEEDEEVEHQRDSPATLLETIRTEQMRSLALLEEIRDLVSSVKLRSEKVIGEHDLENTVKLILRQVDDYAAENLKHTVPEEKKCAVMRLSPDPSTLQNESTSTTSLSRQKSTELIPATTHPQTFEMQVQSTL